MSPYRTPPPVEPPRPRLPWAERTWLRLKRKFLIVKGGGPFKKRFPWKCDVCGRPARDTSGGYAIHYPSEFEPCGHTYTFWRVIREHAVRRHAEKTRKDYVESFLTAQAEKAVLK